MPKKGPDETLTIPVSHKESIGTSRAFDSGLKTLNGGLLSIAKNIGIMQSKLQTLEERHDDGKMVSKRLLELESKVVAQSEMLTNIYELLKQSNKLTADLVNELKTAQEARKPVVELKPEPENVAVVNVEEPEPEPEPKQQEQPADQKLPTIDANRLLKILNDPNSPQIEPGPAPEQVGKRRGRGARKK